MGSKNMNFIYGYCRISTKTQSIERQERNILAAYPAVKRIYKEAATGTKLQGSPVIRSSSTAYLV